MSKRPTGDSSWQHRMISPSRRSGHRRCLALSTCAMPPPNSAWIATASMRKPGRTSPGSRSAGKVLLSIDFNLPINAVSVRRRSTKSGWQGAKKGTGLSPIRVHDLKTYGG